MIGKIVLKAIDMARLLSLLFLMVLALVACKPESAIEVPGPGQSSQAAPAATPNIRVVVPSGSAPVLPSASTRPSGSGSVERQPNPPIQPMKAVFIGDSYTDLSYVPFGAPLPWSSLLCTDMTLDCTNLALGGTGYISPYIGPLAPNCPPWSGGNYRCPPFNERLALTQAADPAYVFVMGGRNELGQENTDAWRDGVRQFYADLRVAAPKAAIFAISPLWDDNVAPPGILEMQNVVRDAVLPVPGACYVDLHNVLQGHSEWIGSDGIHPNAAGQEALKNAVFANMGAWPYCLSPIN